MAWGLGFGLAFVLSGAHFMTRGILGANGPRIIGGWIMLIVGVTLASIFPIPI